jgi:hypothetical protein
MSSKRGSARGLSKQKEKDDGLSCGICFETPDTRGVIDCCNHVFCAICIEEWSKTANTCPFCKERFKTITKVDPQRPSKKHMKIHVPHKDQRVAYDDPLDWYMSSEDDDIGDFFMGFPYNFFSPFWDSEESDEESEDELELDIEDLHFPFGFEEHWFDSDSDSENEVIEDLSEPAIVDLTEEAEGDEEEEEECEPLLPNSTYVSDRQRNIPSLPLPPLLQPHLGNRRGQPNCFPSPSPSHHQPASHDPLTIATRTNLSRQARNREPEHPTPRRQARITSGIARTPVTRNCPQAPRATGSNARSSLPHVQSRQAEQRATTTRNRRAGF